MATARDEAKIGRYEVTEELGRGSMGVVHLAHDPLMCRDVAVKTIFLPHDLAQEERNEFQTCFLQEARMAGSLTHPGIVTIYDFDRSPESGLPFIAMEYVDGRTLHEVVTQDGPIPWEQAFSMIDTLADALLTAHKAGIVHQDIKPANILVRSSDGAPKIADFGIASIHTTNPADQGPTYGSPAYMAPERIQGLPSDARSDLFSLAVILYETLTGSRPFGGEDSTTICQAITQEPPVPITRRDPRLAPGLNRFFDRALAKDPTERFKDATAFKRELGLAYSEQKMFSDGVSTVALSAEQLAPLPTPEPSVRDQLMEWLRAAPLQSVPWLSFLPGTFSHRWIVIGAGAVLIVLASFGFGWSLRGSTPHDASVLPAKARSKTAATKNPAPAVAQVATVSDRYQLPPQSGIDRGPTVTSYETFRQSTPEFRWPPPAPAVAEPAVATPVKSRGKPKAVAKAEPKPNVEPTSSGPGRSIEPAATPEPVEVAPVPAVNVAVLKLSVRSGVKAGSISLSVDGEEVYTTTLAAGPSNPLRRMAGQDREQIATDLELTPGSHAIQARLTIEGKSKIFERELTVDVRPDDDRTLRVVAGRAIGRRLSLSLEQPEPLAGEPSP